MEGSQEGEKDGAPLEAHPRRAWTASPELEGEEGQGLKVTLCPRTPGHCLLLLCPLGGAGTPMLTPACWEPVTSQPLGAGLRHGVHWSVPIRCDSKQETEAGQSSKDTRLEKFRSWAPAPAPCPWHCLASPSQHTDPQSSKENKSQTHQKTHWESSTTSQPT